MKKKRIKEGTWFAVPLRTGGFGIGVVARKGHKGVLCGYFFGPKHDVLPSIGDTRTLCPQDAVFCRQFGDLGLLRGEWPILGENIDWNRADWPMPEFGRINEAMGLASAVRYADEDPSGIGESRPCSSEEARRLPSDGLLGYGAAELLLTKYLSG